MYFDRDMHLGLVKIRKEMDIFMQRVAATKALNEDAHKLMEAAKAKMADLEDKIRAAVKAGNHEEAERLMEELGVAAGDFDMAEAKADEFAVAMGDLQVQFQHMSQVMNVDDLSQLKARLAQVFAELDSKDAERLKAERAAAMEAPQVVQQPVMAPKVAPMPVFGLPARAFSSQPVATRSFVPVQQQVAPAAVALKAESRKTETKVENVLERLEQVKKAAEERQASIEKKLAEASQHLQKMSEMMEGQMKGLDKIIAQAEALLGKTEADLNNDEKKTDTEELSPADVMNVLNGIKIENQAGQFMSGNGTRVAWSEELSGNTIKHIDADALMNMKQVAPRDDLAFVDINYGPHSQTIVVPKAMLPKPEAKAPVVETRAEQAVAEVKVAAPVEETPKIVETSVPVIPVAAPKPVQAVTPPPLPVNPNLADVIANMRKDSKTPPPLRSTTPPPLPKSEDLGVQLKGVRQELADRAREETNIKQLGSVKPESITPERRHSVLTDEQLNPSAKTSMWDWAKGLLGLGENETAVAQPTMMAQQPRGYSPAEQEAARQEKAQLAAARAEFDKGESKGKAGDWRQAIGNIDKEDDIAI